jgi:hypothetical protein
MVARKLLCKRAGALAYGLCLIERGKILSAFDGTIGLEITDARTLQMVVDMALNAARGRK